MSRDSYFICKKNNIYGEVSEICIGSIQNFNALEAEFRCCGDDNENRVSLQELTDLLYSIQPICCFIKNYHITDEVLDEASPEEYKKIIEKWKKTMRFFDYICYNNNFLPWDSAGSVFPISKLLHLERLLITAIEILKYNDYCQIYYSFSE